MSAETVLMSVAALTVAGVRCYFNLGRLEDPEFTIRSAQVVTDYPGATPALAPDASVSCQRFVLGPGEAQKIQLRLTGPDIARLRAFGDGRRDGRVLPAR